MRSTNPHDVRAPPEIRNTIERRILAAFGPDGLDDFCWHEPEGSALARFGVDGRLHDAAYGGAGGEQEDWNRFERLLDGTPWMYELEGFGHISVYASEPQTNAPKVGSGGLGLVLESGAEERAMQGETKVLLDALGKLKAEQRSHLRTYNALLPNVVPKALGLIHARAAWDIDFAKRLVFDRFKLEGAASRDSSREQILDAVQACLAVLHDELDDSFKPTPDDWKCLEKVASL